MKKQLNSRLIIISFLHFSYDDIQNANERNTTGRHKTDDKANNENNIDGEVLNVRFKKKSSQKKVKEINWRKVLRIEKWQRVFTHNLIEKHVRIQKEN